MTPTDIIVVDDETDLRLLLEDYLTLQGFSVRTAPDTSTLDRHLATRKPDVIILDVTMPGESGHQALARLRRQGLGAAVIMLTAQGTLPDRVNGLAAGADDYVVKPFEPRELLARIRAVLRRVPSETTGLPPAVPEIRVGDCTLDQGGRSLRDAAGEIVPLTTMEFDLLEVFVRHPRQVLSRTRLCELAHGRPLESGDRSIDLRVLRLRKKVEKEPADPRTLRTVHGEGYVFDPDA